MAVDLASRPLRHPIVHRWLTSPEPDISFPLIRAPPMGLFGRKKTTVGLDIGSGLVKVAVVDHSKKQPELVKVAVVPLLADAIVEGEVMDPGIVAEAIQGALSAAGVKSKQVVTAVGGRDVRSEERRVG